MYVVQIFNPVTFTNVLSQNFTYPYGGTGNFGWIITDPTITVGNNANWTILRNGVTAVN
jgi:hypothetical protein